ncbi:ABC transporter permease [Georgenia alba]|uniref:ABC transporter permease n=1 Tax=Georgenia alba TaxID=2233858 RepID=A0ABW2Q6K3_9MICO
MVGSTVGAVSAPAPRDDETGDLRALAERHGLKQIGIRPGLVEYLRQLWFFRQFAGYLASSRAYAQNQNSYLGQAWAILTPVLNAAVYVVIFGLVLRTSRGVENAVAFIVIGVFLFRFFDRSVVAGGRSISDRLNLVRSLHFPRAVMPISAVLTELSTLLPALVVMCVLTLASGLHPDYPMVPVTWEWLLLPVAVGLFGMFNVGCAFISARIVAAAPDVLNVIQFLLRFVFYGSGVIFPIGHYVERMPAVVGSVMEYQPAALALDLGRQALMDEPTIPLDPTKWLIMLGWGVLFLVGGFLYFWHGEERYGRE